MNPKPITILTPVHDRPLTFPLCEYFMRRAIDEYGGEVQWILVDDGDTPASPTMGQQHIRRENPSYFKEHGISCPPALSFLGNVKEGLKHVKHDWVFFIEDDDWHSPDYLSEMMALLGCKPNADMIGENCPRYYHFPTQLYHIHSTMKHTSFCQTGMRSDLIPEVLELIENFDRFDLDRVIWNHVAKKPFLWFESVNTIGMKGLTPGTFIGAGHNDKWYKQRDINYFLLKYWIGQEDFEMFMDVWENMKKLDSAPSA